MADDSDPPRKFYGFKPKEFDRANPDARRASHDPNDVRAVLRENLHRANEAGLNDVVFAPPRRSKRKRDYIFAMIVGNMALAICTIISPLFGGAGIVIYNVGITWVMWGVMDDY